MKATKTPAYDDEVVMDNTITTTIRFEDSENVFFEPTKGGMQVVMKGDPLPEFNGNIFSTDFTDYMAHHKLSDVAINQVYDAVYHGLKKGMALDAILECMR